MTVIGAVGVLICVGIAGLFIVVDPFGGRPEGQISIAIDTPYVGQGVAAGTNLVMNGVKVGEVTAVSSAPRGGVRLDADVQAAATAGLTDTMKIDFRPVNYFGVTGINIVPGSGGLPLRDRSRIGEVPTGNFTLQALLSRLGSVSNAALTPRLIKVIDRATRYTDALDPLIETVVIATNALANVQTVPTARLLLNTTGISVALPSFTDAASETADRLDHSGGQRGEFSSMTEDFYRNKALVAEDLGTYALFDKAGELEGKHMTELLPFIEGTKALTDTVPGLIRPEAIGQELVDLRTRLETLYSGTPGQRAVKVRIVLDSLPGIAAPLSALGAQ